MEPFLQFLGRLQACNLFSFNKFNGEIPNELGENSGSLMHLHLASSGLSDSISSNLVTGLSMSYMDLVGLYSSFFYRNALINVGSGPSPSSLSEFVLLHDFGRNQFTGYILCLLSLIMFSG
ncbi:hypothetical protein J1N35_028047 [Gossypium stocksii]|uniref:Uncharacterized protein n=1 Tax=Gossypium stocksii TaxID=47602 RepID=A0A9D3UVC3_9ROSI|nr:hypothetical protein J1N35_028047 [Gossypium stocksii]